MITSLGIIGDLDDVDMLMDIDAAFCLQLADEDIERCRTVGDLFNLIERQLPMDGREGACATAMCFYRLRRALRHHVPAEIRPASPISILQHLSARQIYKIITDECCFRPPPPATSFWGCIALGMMAGLPIAALASGWPWPAALAGGLVGLAAFKVAPIRLPPELKTFGDLVRMVSSRSIGALSKQGARLGAAEAWAAFKDVLSDHTILPKDKITPETLIMEPERAKA